MLLNWFFLSLVPICLFCMPMEALIDVPVESAIEISHNGAGVLPYRIDQNGELWILLGREAPTQKWCDFGGGSEPKETVLDTAVREAWEETRALIGGPTDIRKELENATLFITPSNHGATYVSFLMAISDEMNPLSYEAVFETIKPWKYQAAEKDRVKWFIFSDVLQSAINNVPIVFGKETYELRSYFAKTLRVNQAELLNWSGDYSKDASSN